GARWERGRDVDAEGGGHRERRADRRKGAAVLQAVHVRAVESLGGGGVPAAREPKDGLHVHLERVRDTFGDAERGIGVPRAEPREDAGRQRGAPRELAQGY